MKNFIFISPNFPDVYYKFCNSLKERGFNVLGILDCHREELTPQLKAALTHDYFVSSIGNYEEVDRAVKFFKEKYGEIDYLESNNEFWLEQDARLRLDNNVLNGLRPDDMANIKFKSKMKACFEKAGVKVARYQLVSTIEKSLEFIAKVGYPVFVKPDNGVGANDSYAIRNEEELKAFHNRNLPTTYIMEEFLEGEVMSFDGIADNDSNVVICFNEHFPIDNAEILKYDLDDYYYALSEFDEKFKEMGKRVVKSFGIKKRCFHIEFFKLSKPRPGLAEIGEIVAMEVNMRPPGGNTPDLLSIALNASFYNCYGDIIAYNEIKEDINKEKYVAMGPSRKNRYKYKHSDEEIFAKYKDNLKMYGKYNKEIAMEMGDVYYFGQFKTLEEAMEFEEFVREKI